MFAAWPTLRQVRCDCFSNVPAVLSHMCCCCGPCFFICPAVYTSSVGPETAVTVALLSMWPIIVEATKTLNKGKVSSRGGGRGQHECCR